MNPTGKKKLKAALQEERYEEYVKEAIQQQMAGAQVLDVNVGLPGIDETKVMVNIIKMLQEVVNLPLQIDSSSPEVIEKACRYYNGKPLINSVNGKEEVMEAIFPIVEKYGGVVIGLTLKDGIPLYAQERYELAKAIIEKAKTYHIDKKDIIIDCLTLTASAQQKEVQETLKALTMVKNQLSVYTTLGVSNVSFGLPNRPLLNRTFLTLALQAGLDLPIINPLDQQLMDTIDAYRVLSYQDKDAIQYIEKQSQHTVQPVFPTTDFTLHDIIIHGLKDEQLHISDDAFMYVIRHYTREAGVRQLERLIAKICRKAVLKILKDQSLMLTLNVEDLEEYLGKAPFEHTKKLDKPQVGVVTGMAYTQYGGDILPIEVNHFAGSGKFIITGQLGDVMKESASIALDYMKANSQKYGLENIAFDKQDIHIHVPEGAVKKDGPSAGVTLTTAILSAFSNRPVRDDVAMTGEITLRGQVLPIGGLKEKSISAHRSGIRTIIIPKDNEKDIDDIPESVQNDLNIILADNIDTVLENALVKQ